MNNQVLLLHMPTRFTTETLTGQGRLKQTTFDDDFVATLIPLQHVSARTKDNPRTIDPPPFSAFTGTSLCRAETKRLETLSFSPSFCLVETKTLDPTDVMLCRLLIDKTPDTENALPLRHPYIFRTETIHRAIASCLESNVLYQVEQHQEPLRALLHEHVQELRRGVIILKLNLKIHDPEQRLVPLRVYEQRWERPL